MRDGSYMEDSAEDEAKVHARASDSLRNEDALDGWVDKVLTRRVLRRMASGMAATDHEEPVSKKIDDAIIPTSGTRSRRYFN
jgi:hypothetical protein